MKITKIRAFEQAVDLSRPYTIATRTITNVQLFYVILECADGTFGVGSASPGIEVTGESREACAEALSEERLHWLQGADARHLGAHCQRLKQDFRDTPAARAAVDMALYDLFGKLHNIAVVDLLGRRGSPLPTSITVGIKSTAEALAEAEEYLGCGFRRLKIKIGLDYEADVERLERLRDKVGPDIGIRVDGNQGYSLAESRTLEDLVTRLDLELVEQPLPQGALDDMRRLPEELRRRSAADESLLGEADALALVERPAACGIFNIKLMKCGGITSAVGISTIAETAGVELMWGCMDESVVSIAAALHAAYACPNTRYLDLDGSFDLASDLASGGFVLRDGCLHLPEGPGLGVQFRAHS